MLCKRPYQQRRSGIVHPVMVKGDSYRYEITPFACGQCFHCRINQARIWQTRIMLECLTCTDSTFLTLTYDEMNVPWNYHLVKEDLTLFIKRYRERLGHKIRYYAIGEYGDETWRPHYHLCIFSEERIERCYRSCEDMRKRGHCTGDCIASLSWNKGNVSVTPKISEELAGYITGYIKKKATKDRRINRPNEYATHSRGRRSEDPRLDDGGIGYRAIKQIGDNLKNYKIAGFKPINSVNIGGRPRPLGPYLSAILSDQLGVSESSRTQQFVDYSNQIIKENLKNGKMLQNILTGSESKRHARETKFKKFKRKKRTI